MLDRLRNRLGAYLDSVGLTFSKVSGSPTSWTAVGLLLSFLAAGSYSTSGYLGEAAGGALVLAAGFFDIVDGAVAKATGRTSRRGAFLDSTLDRVAEVVVFGGIMLGGHAPPVLVLGALSASLLVSYSRAKGDALGVSLSGVGIGERSERLLVLAVSSLFGLVSWGTALVFVLAAYTFGERVYRATKALA